MKYKIILLLRLAQLREPLIVGVSRRTNDKGRFTRKISSSVSSLAERYSPVGDDEKGRY